MVIPQIKSFFFAQMEKLTVFNNCNISQYFPNIVISLTSYIVPQCKISNIYTKKKKKKIHNGAKLEMKV